ncbi:hypothetical protein OsJ_33148 [Oryza sativa Japonica Group]|uniref:DUF1618 domain-containing protein n=1 Tax=Oryza sativa subsp. japonica TaxID=39947 RepID=A3C946_ORYSJ|nr:hypothetical protein OsJ_33148 [Oryza sativa Japonica Group]
METQPTPATLRRVGCYDPRWALLERDVRRKHKKGSDDQGDRDDSSNPCSAAGGSCAETEASCRNSAGHVVRLSLCREAPPASSRMWYTSSPSHDEGGGPLVCVVAAHRDSVLLQMHYKNEARRGGEYGLYHFVYSAGDAAAGDPPSLSLLPIHWVHYGLSDRTPNRLDDARTGLLRLRRRRCGDNDLVVSKLTVTEGDDGVDAELLVFRSGEWSVTPAEIIHDDGKADELFHWKTDMVVPVGDRRLCWVDLYRGIILCDMFDDDEPLRPRYVSLPVEPPAGEFDDDDYGYRYYEYESGGGRGRNPRLCLMKDRTVCATNGGGGGGDTLKFVDIFPRCCCGGPGVTTCDHSSSAFVINTWTLRTSDMTWTMDAIVDATELWSLSLHADAGIPPHKRPYYPVVSTRDSHIICFLVYDHDYCVKEKFWKIMLDTTNKTLPSVFAYKNQSSPCLRCIPSEISGYLLTSCSSDSTKPAAIVVDVLPAAAATTTTTTAVISKKSHELSTNVSEMASPEEILAALEEIPDLGCDDLLEAYSLLINDGSGRRFRSLLVLPMGLRKKWLLIEVKNSQACSICSACTTQPTTWMGAEAELQGSDVLSKHLSRVL